MIIINVIDTGGRVLDKIRIGIIGYGNLGKSAEIGIGQNPDMELIGVFTRRSPDTISLQTESGKVYHIDDAKKMRDKIDVMILCGGSKSDLPEQGPEIAHFFNTVDGYDTHAQIPEYFAKMDKVSKSSNKVSVISSGWDPGMFSLNRLFGEVILPEGQGYTFWGKGISQGHSDAVRRVQGVLDGRQYTIPMEEAINKVRSGEVPILSNSEKHLRECYVVAEEGADLKRIEKEIKNMPDYFADYNTVVHFVSKEELEANHGGMAHGGFVIHSGTTGMNNEHKQLIEYSIKLGSNPDFTAHVLLAYARAAYRLYKEGKYGAKTVLDIAPAYLSMKSVEELRASLL